MGKLDRIEYELKRAGFKLKPITEDTKDKFLQAVGNGVHDLCEYFVNKGYNDEMGGVILSLFKTLMVEGKQLGELTSNPKEWVNVSETKEPLYQSIRNLHCYSTDLLYYYDESEKGARVYHKLK